MRSVDFSTQFLSGLGLYSLPSNRDDEGEWKKVIIGVIGSYLLLISLMRGSRTPESIDFELGQPVALFLQFLSIEYLKHDYHYDYYNNRNYA